MEIKPMLLHEKMRDAINFEDYKDWIAQIKYNGVFAMIHVKDGKISSIRNRNNQPTLYLYPELEALDLKLDLGILIAELVVMKKGKSVFYNGIDQRRSRKTDKENPVSIFVHDALKINTETLVNKPYKERYQSLVTALNDVSGCTIIENHVPSELWKTVEKDNEEGIVMKNPTASYEIGLRSMNYLKVKNYKEVTVVIKETEPNEKGTKIFGNITVDGKDIEVETQIGGEFNLAPGQSVQIKYLDIYGNRLIQPTKVR